MAACSIPTEHPRTHRLASHRDGGAQARSRAQPRKGCVLPPDRTLNRRILSHRPGTSPPLAMECYDEVVSDRNLPR
eukprot:3433044-Rhodomonas_salina.1